MINQKVREKLGWQKAFELAKYRLIVFKWSSCYKKENMRRCVIEGRGGAMAISIYECFCYALFLT